MSQLVQAETVDKSLPRWWAASLLAVLAVAFLLRVHGLGGESLDGDELFSLRMARLPALDGLRAVLRTDYHPPLYYMALKACLMVTGVGQNSLRCLSLLSGLLVVGLTAHLGRILFRDVRIALIGAALVCLSDAQIFYSQHARSYAMFSSLVLVMLVILWRAYQKPDDIRVWIAFSAIGLAIVYTHYYGWFYVLSTLPDGVPFVVEG